MADMVEVVFISDHEGDYFRRNQAEVIRNVGSSYFVLIEMAQSDGCLDAFLELRLDLIGQSQPWLFAIQSGSSMAVRILIAGQTRLKLRYCHYKLA